jgi:hypothetical protein
MQYGDLKLQIEETACSSRYGGYVLRMRYISSDGKSIDMILEGGSRASDS